MVKTGIRDIIGNVSCITNIFQAGRLLVIGDLVYGAALQLEYPEVCASYDMDKEQAVKTRIRLLQYAEDNGLTMAGMHLPEPAFR